MDEAVLDQLIEHAEEHEQHYCPLCNREITAERLALVRSDIENEKPFHYYGRIAFCACGTRNKEKDVPRPGA